MWDNIDWPAAEHRLALLQRDLSRAAADFDKQAVKHLQDDIVADLDCRCLAVRKVAKPRAMPGVDGIRLETSAQKMAAALALDPRDYHAQPQIHVKLKPKTGRERIARVSTMHDRAMATLYSYALKPVTEASADKKSFAFRKGRSAHDAAKYVIDAFKGQDAPKRVLILDVKSFYDSIAHEWLMENVPMDKHVLRELLGAGVVVGGALFPTGNAGISLGNTLSPILGNFTLDGLQRAVRKALDAPPGARHHTAHEAHEAHEAHPPAHPPAAPIHDFRNGELIRFADDIIVALRTADDVARAKAAIESFLAERGLVLNEAKTHVCTSFEPFNFIGYTFQRKGDSMHCWPSDASVERFCAELKTDIAGWRCSQRKLIEHLNPKLKGWAGYFRYGDSLEALQKVDFAVTAALLETLAEKYPNKKVAELTERFWYREPDGTYSFCLPDNRTCKVCHIADTPIASHRKVRAPSNPYLDSDYFAKREEERDIANVSGPWRPVWDRQRGLCHFCGTPILPDQPKLVVAKNGAPRVTPKNAAYIHEACAFDEVATLLLDTPASIRRYDAQAALEPLAARALAESSPVPDNWRYLPLMDYFARLKRPRVKLSFMQIEAIIGGPLPLHARERKTWWSYIPGRTHPPRAWAEAGYTAKEVDLKARSATFVRTETEGTLITLPPQLANHRIPDNAAFEFTQFCLDLIDRYSL